MISVSAAATDRQEVSRDEKALVDRMLAGEREAFDEFAGHYIPALYRFAAARLSHDSDLTRDIAQSTVCKAIAKLASFRGEAGLLTWMIAICRNEIAMHFRRLSRVPKEVEISVEPLDMSQRLDREPPAGPGEDLLRAENAELVHMALDLLPDKHGKALQWKYLEDLPVKEIAVRLEVSAKAAESLLTRARRAFRVRFEELIEDLSSPGHAAPVAKQKVVLES